MSFLNVISKNNVLPISDLISGNEIISYFNFFITSKFWSRSAQDNYQNQRLKELIRYAFKHVPYNNDLFNNLTPNDINSKEDLNSGRKFTFHYFSSFFRSDDFIQKFDQFQVLKVGLNVTIRVVARSYRSQQLLSKIKEYWDRELQCEVHVELVDKLPLTKYGEWRYIINDLS